MNQPIAGSFKSRHAVNTGNISPAPAAGTLQAYPYFHHIGDAAALAAGQHSVQDMYNSAANRFAMYDLF